MTRNVNWRVARFVRSPLDPGAGSENRLDLPSVRAISLPIAAQAASRFLSMSEAGTVEAVMGGVLLRNSRDQAASRWTAWAGEAMYVVGSAGVPS